MLSHAEICKGTPPNSNRNRSDSGYCSAEELSGARYSVAFLLSLSPSSSSPSSPPSPPPPKPRYVPPQKRGPPNNNPQPPQQWGGRATGAVNRRLNSYNPQSQLNAVQKPRLTSSQSILAAYCTPGRVFYVKESFVSMDSVLRTQTPWDGTEPGIWDHPGVVIKTWQKPDGTKMAKFVLCQTFRGGDVNQFSWNNRQNFLKVGEDQRQGVTAHCSTVCLPLAPGSEKFPSNTWVQIFKTQDDSMLAAYDIEVKNLCVFKRDNKSPRITLSENAVKTILGSRRPPGWQPRRRRSPSPY